jgi:hypothetical protein
LQFNPLLIPGGRAVPDSTVSNGQVKALLKDFANEFQPLEKFEQLIELTDFRTGFVDGSV